MSRRPPPIEQSYLIPSASPRAVVYLAGPYRAPTINGVRKNIRRAEEVAAEFWSLGFPTIAPHLNTAFMDGAGTDAVFLDGDREILRRCDVLCLLPRWEHSAGSVAEAELADELGLTVLEWTRLPTGFWPGDGRWAPVTPHPDSKIWPPWTEALRARTLAKTTEPIGANDAD